MEQKLSLFKELFLDVPNISVLHIDNSLDLISKTLEEIRDKNSGNIKYINFKSQNDAKIRATAREYEYVVLGNILSYCPNKDKILQLMYTGIENSGNIIILEKKSNQNSDEILKILDELGFMASNNINLFEDFNLLTAKKMHHWGKGL